MTERNSLSSDTKEQRQMYADSALAYMRDQIDVQGLNSFLNIVIVRTYDGMAVRGVSVKTVIPMDEKFDTFMEKIARSVEEFVNETLRSNPALAHRQIIKTFPDLIARGAALPNDSEMTR